MREVLDLGRALSAEKGVALRDGCSEAGPREEKGGLPLFRLSVGATLEGGSTRFQPQIPSTPRLRTITIAGEAGRALVSVHGLLVLLRRLLERLSCSGRPAQAREDALGHLFGVTKKYPGPSGVPSHASLLEILVRLWRGATRHVCPSVRHQGVDAQTRGCQVLDHQAVEGDFLWPRDLATPASRTEAPAGFDGLLVSVAVEGRRPFEDGPTRHKEQGRTAPEERLCTESARLALLGPFLQLKGGTRGVGDSRVESRPSDGNEFAFAVAPHEINGMEQS
jgi:hypothetical protein